MDALKQDLVCEFHAEDRVYDCTFLHDWDMFAAAQNKYLHIYDSQGTELHCMRTIREAALPGVSAVPLPAGVHLGLRHHRLPGRVHRHQRGVAAHVLRLPHVLRAEPA